jgi:DNA-binding NarL/FixJ family response regulator
MTGRCVVFLAQAARNLSQAEPAGRIGEAWSAAPTEARTGRHVPPRASSNTWGRAKPEILRPLASSMTSGAIARLLNLSPKTVRNHHDTIKIKIGAWNDAQLSGSPSAPDWST